MLEQDQSFGKKLGIWAGLSLLFVLTRGLLALPWLLISIPKRFGLTLALQCGITLAVWLLAVNPERRFHCRAAMLLAGEAQAPFSYREALRLGLSHFLRASWAAVPAAGLALLMDYVLNSSSNLASMRMLQDIGSVASLFGVQRPTYDVGLGVLLAANVLFLVLLLILWYRATPNDYLGVVRPHRRAPFDRLALRNFLLAAVAYILWGIVLYVNLSRQLSVRSGLMAKALHIQAALREIMHRREALLELWLVLLVYCPLWCVRKYGAAKAAARLRDAD